MAYQVLARKYRPQLFSDVAGQDHVTRTLLNALAQNRIAHGYIFSGHRGIGKTTIARILAMALNCSSVVGTPERPSHEPCLKCVNCREISSASRQESSVFEESHSFDVEEIDAATNRGIDDARLLTSKIQARPTSKSKYRIIILDEAHQITDAAWNAMLKTLEEPPEWAIFMFATTQAEDIPQTIRSRCQHFTFHAVSFEDVLAQLRKIAEKEDILADDEALGLLAEAGDGSMRDALSIMDQAIASAPMVRGASGEAESPRLEAAQIRELMGTVPNAVFERLLEAVSENQSAPVIEEVNWLLNAGNSASQIARQFVRYLRNVLMARIAGEASELLQLSPDERARAGRSALLFEEEDLTRFLQVMLRTFDELNYRQEPRFHLELGVLKLVHLQRLLPVEQLLSQFGGGGAPPFKAGGGPLPGGRTLASPTSRGAAGAELGNGLGRSQTSPVTASPDKAGLSSPAPSNSAPGKMAPDPVPSSSRTSAPGASAAPSAASQGSGAATAGSIATPAHSAFSPFEADSKRKSYAGAAVAAAPGQASSRTEAAAPVMTTPASRPQVEPSLKGKTAEEPEAGTARAIIAAPQLTTPALPPVERLQPVVEDTDRSANSAEPDEAVVMPEVSLEPPIPVAVMTHHVDSSQSAPEPSLSPGVKPESAGAAPVAELPAEEVTKPAPVEEPALVESEAEAQAAPEPAERALPGAPAAAVSLGIGPAPSAGERLPESGASLDSLRDAVCEALERDGHNTAASLLAAGRWTETDDTVQIEVAAKKTMLGLTMNAEAEKICRNAMRSFHGAGGDGAKSALKQLVFVPGEGVASTQARAAKPRVAASGSVQALAMQNPLVQQAQTLFNAEVLSVLDLRDKG